MITTDPVPGSPCWLDLGAPDVETAAAFYGAVFGWQASPFGDGDAGGYSVFRLDGKVVGAVGPLTDEGDRSAWTIYFHTPDADATVKAVQKAGGAVRVPPTPVGANDGRFAQLTDPQGAQFAVWQPGELLRRRGDGRPRQPRLDRALHLRLARRADVLQGHLRLDDPGHAAARRRGYLHAGHARELR